MHNKFFLIFSYCFILFQLAITGTNDNDCSEFIEMIQMYQVKIKDLEERNKELELENEEWKRKEEERKGEDEDKKEEEKPSQKEMELYKNLDSRIIATEEEFGLLYRKLKKKSELIDFKLLYRKSVDGNSAADFHKKCDGIGYTVSIIKANTGFRFGGYAENKWTSKVFSWVYDDINSFVFSLDLMAIYNSTETRNEKYHLGEYNGPQFWAFTVSDDTGYTESDFKPYGYSLQTIYHDGNKHFAGFPTKYEINGGTSYFYVSELEVFQVIYQN